MTFSNSSVTNNAGCGLCGTRLVAGKMFMASTAPLRKADAIFGYIHPCMAHPISDITMRL
jgi:hypothetical protein